MPVMSGLLGVCHLSVATFISFGENTRAREPLRRQTAGIVQIQDPLAALTIG